MLNPIVEIKNFSYEINGREILKDISFIVERGEYISVIGQNGAGKSTLLKCINRINMGGKGEIKITGKLQKKFKQKELAQIVSYVAQVNGNIPPFSVFEFVMMGRYPHNAPFGATKKEDIEAVYNALDISGTSGFSERFLDTLSGGEMQKVFIAASLAQQAEILLLDEPTTFLDPKHETEIHELLLRVNKERAITIISVTHNINTAVLYSGRILALKNGLVAFYGEPEKLMNKVILQKIYDKPFQLMKHPLIEKNIIIPELL
jgi:ABC-type cobalamin/Fe3+-siderophores transport system ATPase subunit